MSEKKYLAAAQEFLSTLVEKGTDNYGKQHTPVFCLSLDPDTCSPPKPPEKIDWTYRTNFESLNRDFGYYWQSHLHGSNLIYDMGTIRALLAATEATGDQKFKKAADAYLEFFLENMVSEQTGIFGWGEHIFWNVFLDYVIGGCFRTAGWHNFYFGHELERWTTIYDVMWEKNPEKTLREIDAIYDFKIHNYDTFECNRHSDYYAGRSYDMFTFIKHTGLFTHAFMFAHAKTGEQKYMDWARRMSEVFWNIRNTDTNLIRGCVQRNSPEEERVGGSGLAQIALFFMRGCQWSMDDSILEKAVAYLKGYNQYCRVGDTGDFRDKVHTDGTDLAPGEYEDYWEGPIRIAKAAALAYSLTRDEEMLDLASLIVNHIPADIGSTGTVERCLVKDDIEAREVALSATLDLYELTGGKNYLDRAIAMCDDAIGRFMHKGLLCADMQLYPEGDKSQTRKVYDARTGAGWLALNMMRLQRDLDATEEGTFERFGELEKVYD